MYYKYKIKLKDGSITEADEIKYTYNNGVFSSTLNGVMLYKDKYYDENTNLYKYRSEIFVPIQGYQELIAEQREATKIEHQEDVINSKRSSLMLISIGISVIVVYALFFLGIVNFPISGFAITGVPMASTVPVPIPNIPYKVYYYNYTWMVPCGVHEGFYIIKNSDTQEILESDINLSLDRYELDKTSMRLNIYLNDSTGVCGAILYPSLVDLYSTYNLASKNAKQNVRYYHIFNVIGGNVTIIPNTMESVPYGHGMDCEVMVNGTMINGTLEQCERAARD